MLQVPINGMIWLLDLQELISHYLNTAIFPQSPPSALTKDERSKCQLYAESCGRKHTISAFIDQHPFTAYSSMQKKKILFKTSLLVYTANPSTLYFSRSAWQILSPLIERPDFNRAVTIESLFVEHWCFSRLQRLVRHVSLRRLKTDQVKRSAAGEASRTQGHCTGYRAVAGGARCIRCDAGTRTAHHQEVSLVVPQNMTTDAKWNIKPKCNNFRSKNYF